jgi:hypothetical protein
LKLRETILSNIASAISWEGMAGDMPRGYRYDRTPDRRLRQADQRRPTGWRLRDGQRATTEPSHFLSGRLTGIKLAARNNHVGSTLGECAHHLQTKPSGASRDQGDLSGQVK